MKIIKEGTKKEAKVMRVVCQECSAELEISAKDVQKRDVDCGGMMEGSKQAYLFFKCPCCNHKNSLELAKLIQAFGLGVRF